MKSCQRHELIYGDYGDDVDGDEANASSVKKMLFAERQTESCVV